MGLLMELRRLGETTYLLPGSPATLLRFVEETGRVSVVDPGAEPKRAQAIEKAVEELGAKPGPILLTHGHSDHVVAAKHLGWRPVYAPRYCIAFVESFWARRLLAYGGRVSTRHIVYEPAEVHVDYWVADGNPVPGFRAVALPGHTPGHTGYIVEEEKIVYVGDAVFGEKVLERFGIPFAYDLKEYARTIQEKLLPLADEGYKIVPSHGPVVEGGRARRLLEANLNRVQEVKEQLLNILKEQPLTLDQLTYRLTVELAAAEPGPRELLLNRVPVLSMLAWLEEEDKVVASVSEQGLVWRVK